MAADGHVHSVCGVCWLLAEKQDSATLGSGCNLAGAQASGVLNPRVSGGLLRTSRYLETNFPTSAELSMGELQQMKFQARPAFPLWCMLLSLSNVRTRAPQKI